MPMITAKYDGRCRGCRSPIAAGSRIWFEGRGRAFHPGCAGSLRNPSIVGYGAGQYFASESLDPVPVDSIPYRNPAPAPRLPDVSEMIRAAIDAPAPVTVPVSVAPQAPVAIPVSLPIEESRRFSLLEVDDQSEGPPVPSESIRFSLLEVD